MSWFCYGCGKSFDWTDEQADDHYDQTKHDMEFHKDDHGHAIEEEMQFGH